MFTLGRATRVYLAAGVTDLRKHFDGLYALVAGRLASDPLSGHLFVFCNRRRDRIKILVFDGSGLWVCAKRLEKGRFSWPQQEAEGGNGAAITLSQEELSLLLGGIELGRARRKNWWRRESG